MNTRASIIIIEDEKNICNFIETVLTPQNYHVVCAYTGADGLKQINTHKPDVVLLDLGLPDMDGLEIIEEVRTYSSVPIIVISARTLERSKVAALDMGADDYLPKPFHTAELLARIKSVLRRGKSGGEMALILGNVSLEPESSRVLVNNKELSLLKKEFDILFYFMQRPNHLVDKSVLAEAVWGDHADQADNFHFVYAQMKNLRRKLIDAGANIEIKAIYGFGYKLVPPIE